MTWSNRFRLLTGTLVVLLIVTSATYVFSRRQGQAVSVTAQIVAASYGVGSDYSGLVVARDVKPGDHVAANDPLFVVQSLQVARDVSTGALDKARTDVSASGDLTVRAAVAGTIKTIDVNEGGYVSSGVVVATIEGDASLSAEAVFVLAPRDFGRIEPHAAVDLLLPDQRKVHGTVTDMSVSTVAGDAHVTVTIASDGLVAGQDNGLIRGGTPLVASLHLRDDGPLAGMKDAISNLMRKVGL